MELVFFMCKLLLERKILINARSFPQLVLVGNSMGIKIEDLVPRTSCDCKQPINSLVRKCSYSSVWGCFLPLFASEQKEIRFGYWGLCYSLIKPYGRSRWLHKIAYIWNYILVENTDTYTLTFFLHWEMLRFWIKDVGNRFYWTNVFNFGSKKIKQRILL